jgi:hypothetical protein
MRGLDFVVLALLFFDLATTIINLIVLAIVFKMYSEWVKVTRLTR